MYWEASGFTFNVIVMKKEDHNDKDRRNFLRSLAGLTAGLMMPAACQSGKNEQQPAQGQQDQPKLMKAAMTTPVERDRLGALLPQRLLGKTGEYVTMLGLGGAHIARMDKKEAQATIEAALEGGVRFFDNAESYGSGEGESRYGAFLSPQYRDVAFIMTKTTAKDAKTARRHLEDSLRRLKTDYLDLWQIHSLTSPDDVDRRLEQGVLEVVQEAQASGKVRYIGFTGHTDYHAHLKMLESTDVLETCQMPINVFDPNYKSFINNVLPQLVEKKVGAIAMKTLANGGFFGGTNHFMHGDNPKIVPNKLSIAEALHFVWSLPVSVLITGPDHADMLKEKIELARSFTAYTEAQRQELIDRVADFEGNLVEYYKA